MDEIKKEAIVGLLNECLNRLQNSAASYIVDSDPYVSDKDQDAVKLVQAVSKEEGAFRIVLEKLIEKEDGIPQPGLPDPMLAEMNYLSFPYLLDLMIKVKERELTQHRRRIELAAGEPEVKAIFDQIGAMHADHLAKFKDLRARKYKSAEPEAPPAEAAPEAAPAAAVAAEQSA